MPEHTPHLHPGATGACPLCARRMGVVPVLLAADPGLHLGGLCAVCSARLAAVGAPAPTVTPPDAEPSVAETIAILDELRPGYEAEHDTAITDEALAAAARFADRFDGGEQLTGSAIDLLDEAAARVRRWAMDPGTGEAGRLRAELVESSAAMVAAVDAEAYEQAGEFKRASERFRARLAELGEPSTGAERDRSVVDERAVAAVVAIRTGIPVGALLSAPR